MSENCRRELIEFLEMMYDMYERIALGDASPWSQKELLVNLINDYRSILDRFNILD